MKKHLLFSTKRRAAQLFSLPQMERRRKSIKIYLSYRNMLSFTAFWRFQRREKLSKNKYNGVHCRECMHSNVNHVHGSAVECRAAVPSAGSVSTSQSPWRPWCRWRWGVVAALIVSPTAPGSRPGRKTHRHTFLSKGEGWCNSTLSFYHVAFNRMSLNWKSPLSWMCNREWMWVKVIVKLMTNDAQQETAGFCFFLVCFYMISAFITNFLWRNRPEVKNVQVMHERKNKQIHFIYAVWELPEASHGQQKLCLFCLKLPFHYSYHVFRT